MLEVILCLLFVSITLICYFGMRTTTDAVDQYSERFSATAESNLRKLFLFTDTRKLAVVYFASFIVVPVALLVMGLGWLLSVVSVALLLVAPRWLFARLARLRRRRINLALPDALSQISGAMRAGSTMTLSLQAYVDEQTGPLAQEFSLMLREQRVGARFEDALDNLAERVQSEEMDLVVSASLIAHDLGGNLAEILGGLADTIRRKQEMEGKVNALTAQGRLQGIAVSSLPFGILIPLTWWEPEATMPIFHSLLGWLVLALVSLLVFIGSLMIRKIVSIDI